MIAAPDTDPIWITGVGVATPLGNSYARLANSLLEGRSGVGRVTRFDVAEHPSQIAGQLDALPCPAGLDEAGFAGLPRLEQMALWCCAEALRHSGWWERRGSARIGLILGLGAEWLARWEEDFLAGDPSVFAAGADAPLLTRRVTRRLALDGPDVSLSAACASGNHAFLLARSWLRQGLVDVCLAGACDAPVSPLGLAAFGSLRALSRRNDSPRQASRPFDLGRDGFVMGEGGAVLVLEPASTARRRGARVHGEIAGLGATSDAHHLVIPGSDPGPVADAVRQALREAAVAPEQIDYINAHGTSTPVGDASEARVLREVLGEAVSHTPVSSTKSMTGHLLSGAAAVEAVACLVALEQQALPPTINLDDPDPECDLCHVANQAWSHPARTAVSTSFGFGGSNTCLVVKKV